MTDKKKAKFRECDAKYLRRELLDALASLERFLDPNNTRCAVDPEVRKSAKLYLESWVAKPLREIAVWAHGEEQEGRYMSIDDIHKRRELLKSLLEWRMK